MYVFWGLMVGFRHFAGFQGWLPVSAVAADAVYDYLRPHSRIAELFSFVLTT